MNLKMIGRFMAQLVALEAVLLIPAMAVSLGYGEWHTIGAFGISMAVMLAWVLCLSDQIRQEGVQPVAAYFMYWPLSAI